MEIQHNKCAESSKVKTATNVQDSLFTKLHLPALSGYWQTVTMAIIWAVTLAVLCELVQGVRENIPSIPSPNVLPPEGKEEVIELRIPGARPTKVRHFTISLFSND